jgi:uncharacterized membrane protein YcaP (DUF421 family)
MGKRQLGELDVGELVITILLSDIASLPITNPEKSIFSALIPIATLAALEILTSTLILRSAFVKKLLSSKPSMLIVHGKLDKIALTKARISIEDLVSQIRQNGIYDLSEVDYAILEENGKMSIIPKSQNRQPDMSDLKLPCDNKGIMHIVISDGRINTHGLSTVLKDESWLRNELSTRKLDLSDVLCMTCDDSGRIYIVKGDGSTVS